MWIFKVVVGNDKSAAASFKYHRMAQSLKKLQSLKVKTVFPGHGNPFDKAQLDKVLKISVEEFQKKLEEGEVDDDYI